MVHRKKKVATDSTKTYSRRYFLRDVPYIVITTKSPRNTKKLHFRRVISTLGKKPRRWIVLKRTAIAEAFISGRNYRLKSIYWCCGLNRSCTTLTGEKVEIGTSTKMVFQSAIAPFQRPGSSCARRSRPPLDFEEIKPVAGSV